MRNCARYLATIIPALLMLAGDFAVSGGAFAAETRKPNLPDLNVTYISRTPRYPGYVLKYQPLPGSGAEWIPCLADPETGQALPLKGMQKDANGRYTSTAKPGEVIESLGADKIKRWPDEGEEVTFTAMVCNHGTQPTGEFEYRWYIDGRPVGQPGKHESLDGPSLVTDEWEEVDIGGQKFKLAKRVEGTYCELEMKWKWQSGRHYVRLDLDWNDKIDEICEVNNSLMDATDACSFVMMTDAYTYNTLAEAENHWKSYNFDDILKYHRDQMHRKFRASISEFAPDGILEETRYDVILVQAEGEQRDRIAGVKLKAGWDSHWDFTGYVKRDTPADKKYDYCKNQDWGLPHELGHQLGLIDYYCLDTEGGDGGNLVRDENGDPILLSHFTGMVGMMRGHGDIRYSEVSAAALNSQRGRRRGYFGDYLWAIPEKNSIRILDFAGKPIPNAEIKIYQHGGRYVQPDVVMEGKTDSKGEYELKNRECLSFRTDQGYTIKPNPWGQINIVGTNGVFFIEVKARDFTDYVWLEITRMNSEFLRGKTEEAVYELGTMIPSKDATDALKVKQVFDESGDGSKPMLVWDAINPGETYTVYKRVNHPPRWEPVSEATDTKEKSFDASHTQGNGRYVVIANKNGKLSAPSKEQRVVILRNPMGIVLDEDGRRMVYDSGQSMPVMFGPDNSTIGIFGTFHMGLGGVGDICRTKEGNLLVTTSRRAPIRIFDDMAHFYRGRLYNDRNAGEFGDGDMKFKDPTGITVDSKGRVWVCDTGNGRIQVLDSRLSKLLFKVGEEAGLKAPTKVVELPKEGYYAVSDPEAGKVMFLKADGDKAEVVSQVEVTRPVYLAVAKDTLLVSDEGFADEPGGSILAFSPDGGKLGVIAKIEGKPYGIAWDTKNNTLAVVERTKKRIINVDLPKLK